MRRDDTRRTLIAYDIPDDKRRVRLAKLLSRYGDRVQYSVFVVDISPARLVRLEREMDSVIVRSEDSVLVCDLGLTATVEDGRFSYLGRSRPITDNSSIII
ncbi:CRISPR-associated endonuclease Cas2 [Rhodococcus triatomae]|uniref:CRISPR-associated endoribonuclease Cas2 n=1 Tax=Rhodococcus triatomae TaxID=300028 RepID=A0A1G8IZ44_9NOCA|nr:CRISPR-associated endonuclease Cas2 [Rhodococcus triatomae]QNG19860.1 CRISPR-associated endonuclease Cas2 [Rhodococcus triatomae]QNG24224.1 CRISPR-associated endonuclease Cas2 [Rhodococcus triatomae]SDI24318.1 CRISPR-associated protein Cas2 [Rhodococcus triatomae]